MKIETNLLLLPFKRGTEEERKKLIEFAEQFGNLRIDRLSFALRLDPKSADPLEWYLRIDGAGDLPALAASLTSQIKDARLLERKGPSRDKIRIVADEGESVAYAFINNAEVLIAWRRKDGKCMETLEKALAARAGDKPSALKGPLAQLLRQVPEQAHFALVGELSDEARKKVSEVSKAAPVDFLIFASRDKELTLTARGMMIEVGDGKLLAEQTELGRKEMVDSLTALPPDVKLPAETKALFRRTIEDFKIEPRGRDITVSGRISLQAIQAFVDLVRHRLADQQ
jgi:hypothetical protein